MPQLCQFVINGNDAVLLRLGICHIVCLGRICHSEMGVNALDRQLFQVKQGQQRLGAFRRRIAPNPMRPMPVSSLI